MRLTADKKQFARAIVFEEKQRYVRATAGSSNRTVNCTRYYAFIFAVSMEQGILEGET